MDGALINGLLGPGSVPQRVRDLEHTRTRVIDDATARLRQIERDLHDGAQAQMVAVAMKLGAAAGGSAAGVGYLLKDRVADVGEFIGALSRVAAGGTALDPEVVTQLLGASRRGDGLAALTAREREVLALMAEGRSSKLGLPPSDADHRRVLAVLRYLQP
jgi:hypothetical protein